MNRKLMLGLLALFQQLPKNAGFTTDEALLEDSGYFSLRENRFPSVEERVKLYMSNWYVPPCPGHQDGMIRYEYDASKDSAWPIAKVHGYPNISHPMINETVIVEAESVVLPDMVFFMSDEIITNCAISDFDEAAEKDARQLQLAARVKFRPNMRMYCYDIKNSFLTAWNHVQWNSNEKEVPPALMQFGDNKDSHTYGAINVPIIKKFRSSFTHASELEKVTSKECYAVPREPMMTIHHTDRFQPIVWKLATHRHYEKLYQVYQKDTAWDKKRDAAIFRGQLTGSRDGYDRTLGDEENCLRLKRCRLVYNHANSSIIDASLTSTRGRLPDVLNGVPLMSKKIDLLDMMQCKGLIMIEGNDVASGLKWALLSQSVVLMPPPKHTSWAMEELLEPWVVSSDSRNLTTIVMENTFHLTLSERIFLALHSLGRICY
jgi:hypothetical protein